MSLDRRTEQLFELLEARVVLSLTYYDTIEIEAFAGFPGGEAGSLAGASEDGRFLWSRGTTLDRSGESDPAFLVIEQEFRPSSDFPTLLDASIADINSNGTALCIDRSSSRVFLTDLISGGERRYLDELVTSAPPEFDPQVAEPLELGDGGIIVLYQSTGETSTVLWGAIDGVVRQLWSSPYQIKNVDTAPDNTVVGWRYSVYDPRQWENNRTEGMRWTPEGGAASLGDLRYVFGINSSGDILGEEYDPDLGDPPRTVIWQDGVVVPVEEGPTDWTIGLDDEQRALMARLDIGHNWSGIIPYVSRDGVVVELSELGGYGGGPVAVTDSGVLVFESGICLPITPEVLAHASGQDVLLTTDSSGRVVTVFLNQRDIVGTISMLDDAVDYGEWALRGSSDAFPSSAAAYTNIADGSARFLLLNSPTVYDRARHQLVREQTLFPLSGSATTVFQSASGLERIAILEEQGALRLWFQAPFTDWRGDLVLAWNLAELSRNHLDRRGQATPVFASKLDSFTTPWGAMNIVGLDDAGDLHAVWWSPGLGSPLWTTSNLSAITGAPKLVGNVVASATAWNGMQIMGTDERGHAIAVWWSRVSGGWRWNDLTAITGGDPLEPGSLAGAVPPWGAIELVGRTSDDQIVTYWWAPDSGGWTFESITLQQIGDVPRIAGPVSMAVALDGSQYISGASETGEVVLLSWLADGSDLWRAANLTALALP